MPKVQGSGKVNKLSNGKWQLSRGTYRMVEPNSLQLTQFFNFIEN